MANEIMNKKDLTRSVMMMAEAFDKLNAQMFRTTKLVTMIFDALPEEDRQKIMTELIKFGKEVDEKKEGDSDGEGDAVR